ncbi:MAG: hypothetical protein MUC85_06250 [Anaerolineales bacterium]|jgi:hypothetical protein|nr:hypothetical protein [Anaerolineales bacterium]
MVAPTLNRSVPADFLTTNHYILGQVKVGNMGMIGLLSDITTRSIEVSDANITRIVKPDKVLDYAQVLWLVKQQIICVCLSKREYAGSVSMARAGYTRLQPVTVRILSPVYEIQGTIEWSGRLEFASLMSEGTTNYISVYEAVITATLFPALHIETPVLLFNRSYMDALHILKTPGGTQPIKT